MGVPEILLSVPRIAVTNLPPKKDSFQVKADQAMIRAELSVDISSPISTQEGGQFLDLLEFECALSSPHNFVFCYDLMEWRRCSEETPVAVFDVEGFEGFLKSMLSSMRVPVGRFEEAIAPARMSLFRLIEAMGGGVDENSRKLLLSSVYLSEDNLSIQTGMDTPVVLSDGLLSIYSAVKFTWRDPQESYRHEIFRIEAGIFLPPRVEPGEQLMLKIAQLINRAVGSAISKLGLKEGRLFVDSLNEITQPGRRWKAVVIYESGSFSGQIHPGEIIGIDRDGAMLIPIPVPSMDVTRLLSEIFRAMEDHAGDLADAIRSIPFRT